MFFNLNHLKVTNADENGVMAMVWLDSTAGRDFLADNLTYWEPYQNTPEIYVAFSGNNGNTWSEPLALSGVDVADDFWYEDNGNFLGFNESHEYVPAWDGMTTMYAYPSEYLKYMGNDEEGNSIHRMFMMFHSDDNWGSSIVGEGQAGAGEVIMSALDFHLPAPVSIEDNAQPQISGQLRQNYPNPFSPAGTTIEYNVKSNGTVNLSVFNIKGQLVKTLVDGVQSADNHSIIWNGEDNQGIDAASGVYFYRLKSGNTVETKKLIKIK
ncbi:MAG: T9SS type A sorting domain-containing protein [Candidatus Zophobacter franzmannii]|nr:T9SS type A sorting domain-containing protein [Candidatus Zophobacter franzmannii]